MNEKINIERLKEERYKLPEENIIALNENSVILERNKEHFQSLRREGIEWPVEMQGSGHSDFAKKELKVYYPAGDILLSFVITIHELGHLRQGEYDKRFAIKSLGAKEDLAKESEISNFESDPDAWTRGIKRTKKYCPEILEFLEEKFRSYNNKGIGENFKSFNQFLEFVVKCIEKINILNDKVDFGSKDYTRELAKTIKEDSNLKYLFMEQEKWRTGEKVDKKEIEDFIKKMAVHIAEEKEDIQEDIK
ncbi:MAG: hypothetical protein ABIE43_03755 [Patescibacteria group bacterium]